MVPHFSDCQIFLLKSFSVNSQEQVFFSVNVASTHVNITMHYSVSAFEISFDANQTFGPTAFEISRSKWQITRSNSFSIITLPT